MRSDIAPAGYLDCCHEAESAGAGRTIASRNRVSGSRTIAMATKQGVGAAPSDERPSGPSHLRSVPDRSGSAESATTGRCQSELDKDAALEKMIAATYRSGQGM